MDKISELRKILNETFDWNKARLDCFIKMLLALFIVRTVNLSELAVAFASKAEVSSRYKRLQRFFGTFKLDYTILSRWLFKLYFSEEKPIYLTIDRTNWYWGRQKINIFMLGIAYEGASIPICWTLLPKAGNSNFKEQKELIEKFMELFSSVKIAGLLADREFGSGQLFKWLNKKKLPFYIRIKENAKVLIKKKKWSTAKKVFNGVSAKEQQIFGMSVWIYGAKVYLAGARSERGELMIVATNQHPKNAIAIYLRRWEIECLFQSLKNRGFRFEDTHITKLDRIEKLMAVLSIAFAWAHKVGEWKATKKPIRFNKHRESLRPQNSYFRYGFDCLRDVIISPFTKKATFKEFLAFFQLPQWQLEAIT
jgi:hypothetical protein